MLRPVSLVKRVGEDGLVVLESVYPEQFTDAQSAAASQKSLGPAEHTVILPTSCSELLAVGAAH